MAALIEAGEEVLDLGSGNGIPGIPLAILRGDVEVSLAESVAKRAHALGEIVGELELPVPVYAARGEELLEDFRVSPPSSRGRWEASRNFVVGSNRIGPTSTVCC